jgi:hypothetical protein
MPAAPDGSGNQPPGGAPWGKLTPQALSALPRPPRFPPGFPPEGGLPPEGGCPLPAPGGPDGRRTPCFLRHLLTPLVNCPAGGDEEADDVGVELPPPQPATTMAVNMARPEAGSRACRKCQEHSRSGTWLRPANGRSSHGCARPATGSSGSRERLLGVVNWASVAITLRLASILLRAAASGQPAQSRLEEVNREFFTGNV